MQKTKKKSVLKMILILLAALLAVLVLAVCGYVVYMQSQYYRIPDGQELTVENPTGSALKIGEDYTALTYNIGFGAYGPEYSFFMDSGVMEDGTPVTGKYGKALSRQSVLDHTEGALKVIQEQDTDFVLLQEVDVKAHRSYKVDQTAFLKEGMADYSSVFSNNFHSAYLLYPFNDPHGAVEAGLLTFSRAKIDSAVRRSYPVDNSFFIKFTDLDRCFAVHRIPVENGKELVLINSHMSAYDKGGLIRVQQLELLNSVMAEEYQKGNYVIVGGDFNHALGKEVSTAFMGKQKFPEWVSLLTEDELTDHIDIAFAENQMEVPTCRTADIPWQPGVNFATVVDGFLISDNIEATVKNIDTDFAYSDHNPVRITFKLVE